MAGSLLLGAAGCGGDGEPEGGLKTPKDYKVVAGTELCGGNAMSADASRALKVITGESRFEASGEEYTVEQAAAGLVEAWPYPTPGDEDACRVYTPLGTSDVELRIEWALVEYPTTDDLDPDFTVLKMGTLAGAKPESAFVRFSCRSERFPNQTQAANVHIDVRRWGMPKPVDGDVDALKDAYATVAHSYSLAMAKELGCEKNGGLPEKPVLDPA